MTFIKSHKFLIFVLVFVSMAAWASKFINHTNGFSNTNGGHQQAAILAASRAGASNSIVFVRVTDKQGIVKHYKVESNGSTLQANFVPPNKFDESFILKEFQAFPELFELIYNFASGIWSGTGFSRSNDVITATNRFSMTRYQKNTRTGRVYVTEVPEEAP